MKLILILSAMLGCAFVSGYTTERPNNNSYRGQHRRPPPSCLRASVLLPGMIKTCVSSIIKKNEFRSYLDLDVCQFVKKSVTMGLSCMVKEFNKQTDCPMEVVEEIMGMNSENNMAMKYVEYMFCGGSNPFGPPSPSPASPA
ncbi:unnamed protein product [Owenia fusiformis]|uniref:Uncharacterized protein n=1 Tax=Owenia fusiformis TaxID=6347 RepID=A0A8J1XWJ1_OWEFU|nr:unnamed protein product [Owenia fusiformis]